MSISNSAETLMLDWIAGGATPTRPTARYLSLHSADPGETGANELAASNGYARQAVTFGAASGNSASNTSTHTFTASGGNWNSGASIGYFGLWDASTSGNFIWGGALTTARIILDGESGTWAAGALVLSLD